MNFNFYNEEVFVTPSRKPSEHNCNADKKHRPPQTFQIDKSLCRNLFGETNNSENTFGLGKPNPVNARSFR
jgi:hypothetical protein